MVKVDEQDKQSSDKSCCMTEEGQKKLLNAIQVKGKPYVKGTKNNPNLEQIANASGLDSGTVSGILKNSKKFTRSSIIRFGKWLNLALDEDVDFKCVDPPEPIETEPSPFTVEDIVASWKSNSDLVYSAPACAFISGEHCVMFGHPAIYLPLPMRLYIKIEASSHIEGLNIDGFKCPNPQNPNSIVNTELITDYAICDINGHKSDLNLLYTSVIEPFLKSKFEETGFRITVISSFPLAVGLGSSGALSACIAKALIDKYIDIEKFKSYFELYGKDETEITMLLAWFIENCFHAGRSSGAGAAVAFNGRSGLHPIVYGISRRSYLLHRSVDSWHSVVTEISENGFKALSKVKVFVFDPSEKVFDLPNYPEPPHYNVTIIYSSKPSKTENVLRREVRSPTKSSIERVKYVCKMFDETFEDGNYQNSFKIHRHEIIGKIYLNEDMDTAKKSDQIGNAYLELLMESVGNVSVAIFNSIVSDWKSVPDLMNSCQALLCGAGVSSLAIDALTNRLNSYALEKQLKEQLSISKFGAKMTGAGKGGDVIAFSLYDPDAHKEIVSRSVKDENVIHFDSSSITNWKNPVQGVRRER
jgi:mevalonate kinase